RLIVCACQGDGKVEGNGMQGLCKLGATAEVEVEGSCGWREGQRSMRDHTCPSPLLLCRAARSLPFPTALHASQALSQQSKGCGPQRGVGERSGRGSCANQLWRRDCRTCDQVCQCGRCQCGRCQCGRCQCGRCQCGRCQCGRCQCGRCHWGLGTGG